MPTTPRSSAHRAQRSGASSFRPNAISDDWWMRGGSEARLYAHDLAALAAVIEADRFDAVADWLRVTPSAVSQRIKSLEQRVGQVLVVREKPCRATPAGVPLLRLAAQTALLSQRG
jgi:LysR family transcriptional regulator (chromosome initiation inhibitor)